MCLLMAWDLGLLCNFIYFFDGSSCGFCDIMNNKLFSQHTAVYSF